MNGNFWKWTIITEMLQLLQVGRGNSTSLYKSPKNVLACKASELCFVQYQRIMGVMEREHQLWVLNRKTTRGHVASTWRRPCGQMDLQSARFLVFPSWLDAFIKEKKNKYFSAEIGCGFCCTQCFTSHSLGSASDQCVSLRLRLAAALMLFFLQEEELS